MKQCIFASSNSLIRGSRLAPKAGLFYFPAKGVFRTYKAAACHYRALRSVSARESGLFDSGIWWAAFLSTYVNKSSHAHRNHNTLRKGTPDHPGQVAQTGSRNAEATARLTPRIYSTKVGGKRAGKTPIIHSISVF